jgi:putative heme-binding domain-containing protein
VSAIVEIATGADEVASTARWWLLKRGLSQWSKFGVREVLKQRGIYDPDSITITPISVPEFSTPKLPPPTELMKLTGNPVAGKAQAARCVMCHAIDGVGVDYGPDLRNWVANQGREAFFEAVRTPSASIALGYTGSAVTLTDGSVVEGLVFSQGDPLTVMSTGGIVQNIPASRIRRTTNLGRKSLMLSAEQLGLAAQDLADLAAYLETYIGESKR